MWCSSVRRTCPAESCWSWRFGCAPPQEGRALLLINDRLDVALAAGADGLHLPEASLPVCDAKRVAPSELLVGKSNARDFRRRPGVKRGR